MADEVKTVPDAAKSEAVQNQKAPAAESNAEIATLKTQLAELSEKYEKLNFAKLRIEAKAEKKEAKQESSAEDQTLTARVKAIAEREAMVRKREQFTAIQGALIQEGVSKDQAPRFAKLVMIEEGDKLEMDESDPLQPRILYKESDEKKSSVGDWMKAYLSTDKGAWMKPPKATASSEGLHKVSNGIHGIGGWKPATLKEAMADPTKYAALKRENPAYIAGLK